MRYIVLHLRAPNDRNGNPRRLFAAIDEDGNRVAATDEGYAGRQGAYVRLEKTLRTMRPRKRVVLVDGPAVDVEPAEYRAWL